MWVSIRSNYNKEDTAYLLAAAGQAWDIMDKAFDKIYGLSTLELNFLNSGESINELDVAHPANAYELTVDLVQLLRERKQLIRLASVLVVWVAVLVVVL